MHRRFFLIGILALARAAHAADTPSIHIGATIFADWTDGGIHPSSFNVTRAYLNVTGNVHERISFRITPDIARETGSSSLNGSQLFRLKYAFGQLNFSRGAWVRLGVQQTPLIDYEEGIYRYRFQGPTFLDREGYLTSSDAGLSAHYNLPANYGDIHAGIYNGEGYSKAEANDQKALQMRATIRLLHGVRITGFYDGDNYLRHAAKRRAVAEATYESTRVNAGAGVLSAKDRNVTGRGWSVWLNPKLVRGWELLLRHDDLTPDRKSTQCPINFC